MLQYVRLTNNGKLADRYVTTQVKDPSDPDALDRGRLFAVVEIENPWFPTSQIGQTIINTVAREYFRGRNENVLADFEAALKKVNDTLGHLVQTGETDWVGHLNAVIALAVGEDLHMASVGQIHGWLVRGGKANRAVEASTAPAPGKTFGSVLSGTLEPGDRLILGSSGLPTLVTTGELTTNVFTAKDLGTAALRLAGLLRAKRGQWVNALLVERPDLAAKPDTQPTLQNTLYLDTGNLSDWRLTLSGALTGAHQAVLRAGSVLAKANRKTDDFVRSRILPQSQKAFSESQRWTKTTWQTLREKTFPALAAQTRAAGESLSALSKQTAQAAQTMTATAEPPAPDSLIGKPLYTIRDYTSGHEAAPEPPAATTQTIRDYTSPPPPRPKLALPNLTGAIGGLGQRVTRAPIWRSRSLGFGLIAVALITLLIVNLRAISVRQANTQSREQAEADLASLEDKLEEAKLAKIFNQPEKAAELLASVLTGLDALVGSPVEAETVAVRDETQTQLDTLTSTTRLATLTELATVEDATRVSLWKDHLTLFSSTGLSTLSTDGGEVTNATLPSDEELSAMVAFDEKEGLALLTDKPAGYELTSASGPVAAIGNDWKSGTALSIFFNNIYVLAPADNEIWKYESKDGKLLAPVPYVTDDTSVAEAIDLAIDGSVYTLTKPGEVLKFSRGKRAELAVRDIPKPATTFTDPKQLLTTRDGNTIYVLDGNRVVALDKTGRFQAQYAFKGLTDVTSIAVDEPNKTFYVLAGDKLYKTSF
ncbi:hypothetical protein HY374_02800 [Candidatus Berkelbacteria bacterium]|nr:hypothetical protein [Candidatus Berkelbacteria bacterium]